MRIGLDVMGGDYAPDATISGALKAYKELPSTVKIVLIGDEKIILSKLKENNFDPANFEIVHSSDVIQMAEHPVKAYSQKQDSSIAIGFNLLKDAKIDAFAGCGNSGAMLIGSMYSVNTIPGIIRPCTSVILPKENGEVGVLLDAGTNPDCKPDIIYQFGILGSLYAKYVHNIENPKVGLLNIGSEEEKGNLLCQSSFKLMKDSKDFNFIGNVEGRDLFKDKVDVVVCDGFTGNIVLKQTEAIYRLMIKRNLIDDYFNRFNYEIYGGTPILGVNSAVVIGHGISSPEAVKNMIFHSKSVCEANLVGKIKTALENVIPIKN